jgi:hypothetical protein
VSPTSVQLGFKWRHDICNIQGVSKELNNGIPNVTVWRMLKKRLHLKAYNLSIDQQLWVSVYNIISKIHRNIIHLFTS